MFPTVSSEAISVYNNLTLFFLFIIDVGHYFVHFLQQTVAITTFTFRTTNVHLQE